VVRGYINLAAKSEFRCLATGLITNTIPCWLISVKNPSPSSENVMCLATQQSRDLVLANHNSMFLRSLVIPLSAASRREVLQQFLRSLIEPFLVFLLFFAGFNRMLGSTYPNELLYSRVIHTNDESPDVDG